MRRFWFAAAVLACVVTWYCLPWEGRPRATILSDQTVKVDGVTRSYRLVVPDALPAEARPPLLVVLHGAGGSGEGLARNTGLDRLAADHGCYLVYPEGRHASWPPFIPPENPDYIEPDLLFFDILCDALTNRYGIDRRRIYVVGMSQGAAFANLLVARRSERIAAAVSHSGWLPSPLPVEGIHAAYKCPVMLVGGTDDRQVPEATVREAAACYAAEGHPVQLQIIEGLGHRWASRHSINDQIWKFLTPHRLP